MSDRDYFDSYAGAEVHRLMLADRVRTESYRDAIERLVQPGMIVLDVGCGTGILSLFAARAGAERVYAVDRSEILEVTERIVRANGMAGTISCFAGRAEWLDLPSKVDLIVSEWMGFFALAESMFESVTAARDKHLLTGGTLAPRAIKLCLTPVEDARLNHERGLGFWAREVYGFDYTPMLEYEIADLETVSVRGEDSRALAASELVIDIDCENAPNETYWFDTTIRHLITETGDVHGFLGHFEAELGPGVILSTAANRPLTHWRQSWFPVRARAVRAGDVLEMHVRAKKDPQGDGRRPIYFFDGIHLRDGKEIDTFFYCYHGTFE